jgi:hypothetical protein
MVFVLDVLRRLQRVPVMMGHSLYA